MYRNLSQGLQAGLASWILRVCILCSGRRGQPSVRGDSGGGKRGRMYINLGQGLQAGVASWNLSEYLRVCMLCSGRGRQSSVRGDSGGGKRGGIHTKPSQVGACQRNCYWALQQCWADLRAHRQRPGNKPFRTHAKYDHVHPILSAFAACISILNAECRIVDLALGWDLYYNPSLPVHTKRALRNRECRAKDSH